MHAYLCRRPGAPEAAPVIKAMSIATARLCLPPTSNTRHLVPRDMVANRTDIVEVRVFIPQDGVHIQNHVLAPPPLQGPSTCFNSQLTVMSAL